MKTKKTFLVSIFTCLALFFTALGVGNLSTLKGVNALTDEENEILGYFTAMGDDGLDAYVNDISYGTFTNTNFSGAGVIVETRNKTAELVSNTDNNNTTNPMLINFPAVKYSAGVMFNGVVDISDNTASDTLIELAFPGSNDNYQNRGFKVIIEDASDPTKYIALFVWSAYGNTDATGGSVIAAAAGTWEKTMFSSADVYINEAGFDTNNYNGNAIFNIVGDDVSDGGNGNGDATHPKDGCYLNTKEYGHTKTSVNFSRTSANSIKVQFDNANGTLAINGVHIRDFKNFSADGSHYFPGFTDNKVKLSVGIMRTTRRSTDEFTRFCIMDVDKHTAKAPASGLIASGTNDIPAPVSYSFFKGEKALEDFTVNITDPSGTVTENYKETTFDFNKVGVYSVEYKVNGQSVGVAQFSTALKDENGELVGISSFNLPDNLFSGKKIGLADFIIKKTGGDAIDIASATVTIKKGDSVLVEADADENWSCVLTEVGELNFIISNDLFTIETSANVGYGIYPKAEIQHGTVDINGFGDAVALHVGTNDFTITPDVGYALKSLTVNGVDVSDEVFNNEYIYDVSEVNENVSYEIEFEELPKITVNFVIDGESQTAQVLSGTVFGDIEKPIIPEKEGYRIIGWSIGDNEKLTEDTTANAVYELIYYTVSFYTEDGTAISSKSFSALETVEESSITEIPEKTGYDFVGWYLNGEKFEFGCKLTADISLTARYTQKKIKVTVKSIGVSTADEILDLVYGSDVSAESIKTIDGYIFKGLFTDSDCNTAYNGGKLNADTVLYAKYEKAAKVGCGSNVFGGFDGIFLASLIGLVSVVMIIKIKKTKKN